MIVTQVPFNRLIGLEMASADREGLVTLPSDVRYTNHLGTVHASALLAVAEAGSGEFLRRHLQGVDGVVPVVRRLDAKFRKPAYGRITARASAEAAVIARWAAELTARGRVLAQVPVEVVNAEQTVVLSATVVWFLAQQR